MHMLLIKISYHFFSFGQFLYIMPQCHNFFVQTVKRCLSRRQFCFFLYDKILNFVWWKK